MDEPFSNVSFSSVGGLARERSGAHLDPRESHFAKWVAAMGARGELRGVVTYQGNVSCAVLTAEPSLSRCVALGGTEKEAILGLQAEALRALSSVRWSEARFELGGGRTWLRLVASPLCLELLKSGGEGVAAQTQEGDLHLMFPLLSVAMQNVPRGAAALSLRRISISASGVVSGVGSKARQTMPLRVVR